MPADGRGQQVVHVDDDLAVFDPLEHLDGRRLELGEPWRPPPVAPHVGLHGAVVPQPIPQDPLDGAGPGLVGRHVACREDPASDARRTAGRPGRPGRLAGARHPARTRRASPPAGSARGTSTGPHARSVSPTARVRPCRAGRRLRRARPPSVTSRQRPPRDGHGTGLAAFGPREASVAEGIAPRGERDARASTRPTRRNHRSRHRATDHPRRTGRPTTDPG